MYKLKDSRRFVVKLFVVYLLLLALSGTGTAQDSQARVDEALQLHLRARDLFEQTHYDEAILLEEKSLAMLEKELGKEHLLVFPVLNNLAQMHADKGDYAGAEPLFLRALDIGEKTLGPENFLVARVLSNLAVLYQAKSDYPRAEPLLVRVLAIHEKAFGTESPEVAIALNNLAELYRDRGENGDFARAEPLYLRALTIKEKKLGADDPSLATTLSNVAVLYQQKGEFARAESLFIRALAIREKAQGANHPDVAASLYNLALLYEAKGDYSNAEPRLKRALAIQEKVFGPDHLEVALILNGLAVLYKEKGEYVRAEPLYQRALAIREKVFGRDHPKLALFLNNLAVLYKEMGDYPRAESLHLRALAIQEKVFDAEHPDLANTLGGLAELYREMGNYARAEPLYRRALVIEEKVLGAEHPHVAQSLNNLAFLQYEKGDYVAAEQLYLRALAIREKVLGAEHPEVASTLNNLALLYNTKGDDVRSELLCQRALAIRQKMLAPEHPDVAISLNNLAQLYHQRRDYTRAEPLYLRALATWQKAFGAEHAVVAAALNNLASLYEARGEFARAESSFQKALAIKEKALGANHPDVGLTVRNLAGLYEEEGDYAKAEQLYRRALEIFEKAFGTDHPSVAALLSDLSELNYLKGDYGQAVEFQTSANEVRERNLALILSAGSEREKQIYLNTLAGETQASVWLHLSAPTDPEAIDLAVTTILRRKGRVLDAMADQMTNLRSHSNPEDRALFDALAAARSHLATLQFSMRGQWSPEVKRKEIENTAAEVERLEVEISRRSAEFRVQTRTVTLDAVQQALPSDAALVEIFIYQPPKKGIHSNAEKQTVPGYVAYVVRGDGTPLQFVDLGPAAAIDAELVRWRTALQDPGRKDVQIIARSLDEQVMRPIRKLLRQTQRIFLSPDGALNLIPFAALVDENGKYLLEKYSIDYLTSGRDLLRLQVPTRNRSEPMVMANPLYDLTTTSRLTMTSAQANQGDKENVANRRSLDLTFKTYKPLPGTAEEATVLSKLLPPGAQLFLQEQATEARLKQLRGPLLLHIATHGFFLSEQAQDPQVGNHSLRGTFEPLNPSPAAPVRENPLLRSGLVLAGVKQGQSGTGQDGVLTALEAAGLDLWGTKLVVLSACETGLGEVKNGAGVYGLRRALVLAGSETQVMSLWKVSDAGTRDLMTSYYTRLQGGEGRAEALRQVQLAMLRGQLKAAASSATRGTTDTGESLPAKNYRHPYYWAAFIQSGDWRRMDGKEAGP
jgi:CHAT domain-containing protein/tetratricopeptide (TPR) repeat protein